MKIISLIIALLLCKSNFAQGHFISELKSSEEDKKLQLNDFKNSSDLFGFRFWNHGQVVEIRLLSDSILIGSVTNFLTEVPKSQSIRQKVAEGKIKRKIHVQKIALSQEEIKKFQTIIQTYHIFDLPTDDSIKSWRPSLDGEWFSIEQTIKGEYSIKTFGNPKSQVNVPEATQFLHFYDDLNQALKLHDLFWTFFRSLKISCYSRNGESVVNCIVLKKPKK